MDGWSALLEMACFSSENSAAIIELLLRAGAELPSRFGCPSDLALGGGGETVARANIADNLRFLSRMLDGGCQVPGEGRAAVLSAGV